MTTMATTVMIRITQSLAVYCCVEKMTKISSFNQIFYRLGNFSQIQLQNIATKTHSRLDVSVARSSSAEDW